MWTESTYYKSLIIEDKIHYKKKLTLKSGEILQDPFSIEKDEWGNDTLKIPDILYPDIYLYLIEKPDMYTKEKLKAYKSLEAYNFFISGHVQDIHVFHPKEEFIYLRAKVLPSQRQGQKQECYEAWIIFDKGNGGSILTANCTCMAGLGSACSHAAAILFKIQACTILGLNKMACTSQLCVWKQSRQKAKPAPLKFINFKRPKPGETLPKINDREYDLVGFSKRYENLTQTEKKFLEDLYLISPKAAVLTSTVEFAHHDLDEETDTADETGECSLQEPLTYLFDPTVINENENTILSKSKEAFAEYSKFKTENELENLIKVTKAQSNCSVWMIHRAGRITASIAKEAFIADPKGLSKTLINKILQYSEPIKVAATQYGHINEDTARKKYFEVVKESHINLNVETTGLHINLESQYLAASPDGIVKCDCHGKGLLEIKCPFKYQINLKNWREDKICPIDQNGCVKKNHLYYFQMQHQMLVTNLQYVDFFVWSKEEYYLSRTKKDNELCKEMSQKFYHLFEQAICPELLSRKNDPDLQNQNALYCFCNRPSFNPMIGCDDPKCKNQWFHFSCIGLKSAPEGLWFCSDCRNRRNKHSHNK